MKALYLLLAAVALLLASCASGTDHTVEINPVGESASEPWVYRAFPVVPTDHESQGISDTVQVVDGKVSIDLASSDTLYMLLACPLSAADEYGPDQHKSVQLLVSSADHITVTAEMKDSYMEYSAEGNELNTNFAEQNTAFCAESAKRLSEITEEASKLTEADSVRRQELFEEYNAIGNKKMASNLEYVKSHPASQLSLWYIATEMDDEELEASFNALDKSVQSSPIATLAQERIKYYNRSKAVLAARKNIHANVDAPDFTLPDMNGNTVSLSDYRGKKYVILDFWGSWCGWCIKGAPEMKKYREKYIDRLEIIGVDCRDKDDAFRAAVEKHHMNWVHVVNPEGDDDLTITYAVQAFPTKIVISPEGKIALYHEGEDPEFYQQIDSIMAQ